MDIIWVGLAFIVGLGASRLNLPPLVGYLGAGGVLAWFGYEEGAMLHEIAHLGVLFLLFTVGLHLRIKNILRSEVLGVGGIHLILSVSIFTPVAYLLGSDWTTALIIGIVLGFSSTVLTAKTLERRKELGAFHGRVAIGILILQDMVAITLLAVTGGESPSLWGLLLLGLPLVRPLIFGLMRQVQEEELKLLFGLVFALGGAGLFDLAGLSSELGALAAGMLLSGEEHAERLAEKLWGLKEAFLVGFFLEVGLAGLPEMQHLLLVGAAILLLPLKSILFYGLFLAFKLRGRTAFLATISLTSFSEFTLIAGSVAASAGLIPAGVVVAFALLTALSFVVNAPLASWEEQLWDRWENYLVRFERDVKHPDQQAPSLGAAEFLVIGLGSAGQAAYDRLKQEDKHVVALELDPARIEQNLAEGRRVLYGDPQDLMLWDSLDMAPLKAVILAMGSPQTKVNSTKLMRKSGYRGNIYALTMREDEQEALRKAGASAVCLPITQAGRRLAELSLTGQDEDGGISLNMELT